MSTVSFRQFDGMRQTDRAQRGDRVAKNSWPLGYRGAAIVHGERM